jgi:hypothetical protein
VSCWLAAGVAASAAATASAIHLLMGGMIPGRRTLSGSRGGSVRAAAEDHDGLRGEAYVRECGSSVRLLRPREVPLGHGISLGFPALTQLGKICGEATTS